MQENKTNPFARMECEDQEPFRRDVNQDIWAWPIEQIILTEEEVIDWVIELKGMISND